MAVFRDKITPTLGRSDWVGKIVLNYFEGDEIHTKTIPFFENPMIQESKEARLSTYSPIGRASNSFGYLGANSKKIDFIDGEIPKGVIVFTVKEKKIGISFRN